MATRRFYLLKRGTIAIQSLYRGRAQRKAKAAVKIQTNIRMRNEHIVYLRLKPATITLQCWQRCCVAQKILVGLKKKQEAKEIKLQMVLAQELAAGYVITNAFQTIMATRRFCLLKRGTIEIQSQYCGRAQRKAKVAVKI